MVPLLTLIVLLFQLRYLKAGGESFILPEKVLPLSVYNPSDDSIGVSLPDTLLCHVTLQFIT